MHEQRGRPTSGAKERSMSNSHVILCVDDEPQVLEALAPTLTRKYLVKTATSGSIALDILRSAPAVAVIISDMRMPRMNGAQFLSASRQIVPNARRILLTGHADVPTALAAVNSGGICRLLTKPCPTEEIVEAVEGAITEYDDEARERAATRRVAERDALMRDVLTGLASRQSLMEHLNSYRTQGRTAQRAAEVVFCIEMVNLEELSDSFDSRTTNHAMRIVVAKLRRALLSAQCLAQYRPETFVAVIDRADSSEASAEVLARRVSRVLEQPIEFDGMVLQYRVRVGIAGMSTCSGAPSAVLRYARLAAREAAKPVHNSVCFYSEESRVRDDLRRETIQALRIAVAEEQLQLQYQPIVDLECSSVYSIEALARWEHSRLGVVSPGIFIPLAEKTDLIIPLGEWV